MRGIYGEPWKPWRDTIVDADGNLVIGACVFAEDNKRRIVSCVNALASIPTEELERWSSIERVWRHPANETPAPETGMVAQPAVSEEALEAIVERLLLKHGLLPSPMTEEQALAEARRRWGAPGAVYDREKFAPVEAWGDIQRFWVGGPVGDEGTFNPYGNGDTWEEAFADADRRAADAAPKQVVKAEHSHTMSCYDNAGTLICGGAE